MPEDDSQIKPEFAPFSRGQGESQRYTTAGEWYLYRSINLLILYNTASPLLPVMSLINSMMASQVVSGST